MKQLSLVQMEGVEGGLVELIPVQGNFSSYSDIRRINTGSISPLHYSGWDCVGFVSGLAGMTAATFGTFGIGLVIGGLLSFSGMVASAGNCEGYLNGG